MFKDLKLKVEEESIANSDDLDFKASHGWFETFKICANLHCLHTSCQRASANVAAATMISEELMITEG
jgi:hypothetical protein